VRKENKQMTGEMQSFDQWQSKVRLMNVIIADWESGRTTVEKIQEILENFPGMGEYIPLFEKVVSERRDVEEVLHTILGCVRDEEWLGEAPRTGGVRESEFRPPGPDV
jgi:hypothetical protein